MWKAKTKRNARPLSAAVAGGAAHPSRRRLIALFGSAAVRPGDALYEQARAMGSMLAIAGFDLMTGGSTGVMEAASRGAHEQGAHVIGVTLRRFEEGANRWVKEEIATDSFHERFNWLIGRPDGYVAMSGGMGTLTEICEVWQEQALGLLPRRPLVLVGPEWRAIFACFRRQLIAKPTHYEVITIVDNLEEACAIVTGLCGKDQPTVRKRARRSASIRSASAEPGGRGMKPLV